MTSIPEEPGDEALVNNVKTKSCNDSLMELINRHSGICFSIGKKFSQYRTFNLNDLNDNKDWIIYSAALSFNSTKGSKFSTWLANQVKYYCLNLKNKSSKYVGAEDSTIEFLINQYHNENKSTELKSQVLSTIQDILEQIKDKNIKNAIHYRYFSNQDRILNYSEIGDILNVTPQTVLNWHNKFIELAKKKLTSPNNNDII